MEFIRDSRDQHNQWRTQAETYWGSSEDCCSEVNITRQGEGGGSRHEEMSPDNMLQIFWLRDDGEPDEVSKNGEDRGDAEQGEADDGHETAVPDTEKDVIGVRLISGE